MHFLHSWEELQNHFPGSLMDQLKYPATVPSMTSIYHMVVWAEQHPIHYFLLNRPHYPVSLGTNSRIILMFFPNPLSDFTGWQSSLDL